MLHPFQCRQQKPDLGVHFLRIGYRWLRFPPGAIPHTAAASDAPQFLSITAHPSNNQISPGKRRPQN
jgi:hypothetical protein